MSTPESSTSAELLHELTPTAEHLYERHLRSSEEWHPHELIPYSRGRDFENGYEWQVEDSGIRIDDTVRSALIVNLLTEDNLPYYFRTIEQMYGRDGVWGEWVRRWTAEEGRHSMTIYGYLMTTRAVDPVALERSRMTQVSTGQVPQPETPVDGMVYVALQELATRIAHRQTGLRVNDQAGQAIMSRVAKDENLHHIFYKDLVKTGLHIDGSTIIKAIERQVVGFEMPGTGIPGFKVHEANISLAGIYGVNEFLHGVLDTVLVKNWNIFNQGNLTPEAEQSLIKIERRMKTLGRIASKETEAREAHAAEATEVY